MKLASALVALTAVALLTGCGGSSGSGDTSSESTTIEPTTAEETTTEEETSTESLPSNQRQISRADYGADWPLKVKAGVLACVNGGEVIFTAENGTTYRINGAAGNSAEENGWQDVKPIWKKDPNLAGLRINIGPLIDDGLALC